MKTYLLCNLVVLALATAGALLLYLLRPVVAPCCVLWQGLRGALRELLDNMLALRGHVRKFSDTVGTGQGKARGVCVQAHALNHGLWKKCSHAAGK